MKKILFIMHSMPMGGAERVLVDIMNHVNYDKYEIYLLLRDRDGILLDSVPSKVKVFSLHGRVKNDLYTRIRNRILKMTGLDDYLDRKKTRSLIINRFDCIISFCQGPAHKIHQYLLDYSSNHVSWVHSDLKRGNWGITSFDNNLQHQEDAYNKMDQIVFVSEGAKCSFNELFKIDESISQHIIYNIVDSDNIIRLAELGKQTKPKGKYIFINVGRLVDAKNQHLLLQASEELKARKVDFEVWILGEGPLRKELEDYIEGHSLRDIVQLFGNKKNPYIYVKNADAFVSSSRQEGYPMVLCEALVLGKPIISTNIVGPREVLVDGKYGIIVDETPKALCDAMYNLATNKELDKTMQALSYQRAKDFNIDDFMTSFYSIVDNDIKFQ